MAILDTVVVLLILLMGFLLIWTKIQHQNMLDTLNEIKDFIKGEKND